MVTIFIIALPKVLYLGYKVHGIERLTDES